MSDLPASSSERAAPGRLHFANLLPVIVIFLLATASHLHAQPVPAVMSASASPSTGQVVTFTATMKTSSGIPVTMGTVTFFMANTNDNSSPALVILGTVPVNSSGVASMNYLLPRGGNFAARVTRR